MLDSTAVWLTYGSAFALALFMTLVWRAVHERRVWRVGSTMKIERISAYKMALISGGGSRVALTGVVRLIGRKILVPGVAGVLTANRTSDDELDEVERHVVDAAKTPSMLKELLIRLESLLKQKKVIAQMRGELIAVGYMRAFWSRTWWMHYLANMLPFALLLAAEACGVAYLGRSMTTETGGVAGLATAADAQDLLQEFIGWSFLAMLVVALPGRVTPLGRYIVWSATQHHPDFKTARADRGDAIDIKMLGQSVALYGQDALAGSDMAWIPALMAQTNNSD
ncbi:TIGR04222 domain-containing membrane protein [Paraburkholderia megapolitana]|uniref:TIGR04222 domain-containing membrane protein n=1 Tax=Paraburkholderia megapolitana TaxID=420953 RepID=UPI0038B8129B